MTGLIETADPQTEWLYHAPPVGLVLGPNIIREEGLIPPPQSAVDNAAVAALLRDSEDGSALADHWAFFASILGWQSKYVAGAPGGPELPTTLTVSIPEHEIALSPDWAIRDLGTADDFQILVKFHPNEDADQRGALAGWEATPHQQLERLLRETGITIGVLVDRDHIRIVYAPRGETSGWQSFPIRSLAAVAGRPMLGGLKLLLGYARLFTEPENRRLPKLLVRSREAQNKVSAELSEQVLGALHELLRAFHSADPERIEQLVACNPHQLYEGLLTTLMRLVFLLYAEDRELMPTRRTAEGVEVYETSYSVRGLYARLVRDRALNPDTMDERLGGWGQLLALFRLVHGGHSSGWITARGGKLFDPDEFPFLEGRNLGQPLNEAKVLPIRDGAILRILEGLMTLEAKAISGEKVRERLSYRSLDVEQIGSVYETVMGFTVMQAPSPMIAVKGEKNLPVFVEIEALANKKGADRQKQLKEIGVAPAAKRLEAIKKANGIDELEAALLEIRDERGSPGGHVAQPGAPILQPTDERRRSGSHYTPRSLTEPIVRHALEPIFGRIGELATPDQVLEVKVCDPACGSGAFLVEASRQLGTRLEKSWARHPKLKPAVPPDEEDDIHARRLVAQRCLYGVDKNPMAVDLARLSLWLATLAREHEFTFLDHAIKSGDSLVGLTTAQIQAVNWDTSKPSLPLLRGLVKDRVNEVVTGRREIQFASDDVKRAVQEARHKIVEKRLEQPRIYGDAVVAAFFSADKPKARETKRAEVESLLSAGGNAHWEKIASIASTLRSSKSPVTPLHWELEFPEVFTRDNPGFDTVVGNPPYLGGTKISGAISARYFQWLGATVLPDGDKADLIAYFLRRIFALTRMGGAIGLVATSSITEGDTRKAALAWVRRNNGQIYRAYKKVAWPGEANVDISRIHLAKAALVSPCVLEDEIVIEINSFLNAGSLDHEPFQLESNAGKCFEGFVPYGEGFVIDDRSDGANSVAEISELLRVEPQAADIIFPYLGGEEVTEHPRVSASRQVIYLAQASEPEVRARYPKIYDLLERKVRSYREGKSARVSKAPWWQFLWARPRLYKRMQALDSIIVTSRVSKHHAFVRVSARLIPSTRLSVITLADYQSYAVIQSRVHELWTRYFGASRGATANYSPSDCFENYAFPEKLDVASVLGTVGEAYHFSRAQIMIARNEGMTKSYNRFHDVNEHSPDIGRLRDLHAEMDRAVLRAYGWGDLAERAEPRFLNAETEHDHTYQGRLFWPSDFREEVLARLLKLNAERHEEEVRLGLAKHKTAVSEADEEADLGLDEVD